MEKVSISENNASLTTVNFTRGDVLSAKCPSREVLNHVTSRWGVLVFFALMNGKKYRFSELRRKIEGVSEKMLAQTLQKLEEDGFINRIAHPVVPPHVEYELTNLGQDVGKKVIDLTNWLEDNILTVLEIREKNQAAKDASIAVKTG